MNQRYKKQLFDQEMLAKVLLLAQEKEGLCAPNPSVAALLAMPDGTVLATGIHLGAGTDHAEVACLNAIQDIPPEACLYVTLEPCCHQGRTPACTNAIIQAGVQHVVFGFRDPDVRVAGKGQHLLLESGVDCKYLPTQEIRHFYRAYEHFKETGKAWVIAKLAMTIRGEISAKDRRPLKITGPEADHYTHQERLKSDAILTTVETLIMDNPRLNVRLGDDEPIAKPIYVLDRQLRFPVGARILKTAKNMTCFYSERFAEPAVFERYARLGIRLLPIPECEGVHELLRLDAVFKAIADDGLHQVFIEAGGRLFEHVLDNQFANEVMLYIANKTLEVDAFVHPVKDGRLFDEGWHKHWNYLGNDLLCRLVRKEGA